MFMKFNKIALATALGLATIASTSLQANSMPITVGQASVNDNIVLADYNSNQHMGQNRQWSRMNHGNRCRVANGNCRHFYRGYYYETPWWTLPLIAGGVIASQNGNGHVAWCRAHYRHYRAWNNTYQGKNGKWYVCRGW